MNPNKAAILFMIFLGAFALYFAGKQGSGKGLKLFVKENKQAAAAVVRDSGDGTIIRDEIGRPVNIRACPSRIVPLAANILEMLYTLGAGDKIVARTAETIYPPEAASLQSVGYFNNPNIEKILLMKPDLVLATFDGNRRETVAALERSGITVYVINPQGVSDILTTMEKLSYIVCADKEGRKVVFSLMEELKKIESSAGEHRPSVFFQISMQPLITAGRDTFINDLIEVSGGRNVFSEHKSRYPVISVEDVIFKNPDVIIYSYNSGYKFEDRNEYVHREALLRFWERWTSISAVKNKRLFVMNGNIVNVPSDNIFKAFPLFREAMKGL